MSRTALIGLDWGTSSLRAYRIAADGSVLERRETPAGILNVVGGGFRGALSGAGDSGLFVLPGTHSKWAVVEAGRVTRFRTLMTCDVYQALKHHTILGRPMVSEADDPDAFARGVGMAGPGGAGLLGRLFSARTLGLFGRLPETSLASYLSGLLLGSEIEEATAWLGAPPMPPVTLIGTLELTARYRLALAANGIAARPGPADARGLSQIARAAGLFA